MEIPLEIQALIIGAITFIVTEGLKVVSQWFGRDLSGAASAVTAGLVACALALGNVALGYVPAEYIPAVKSFFGFLVALLSAFGLHRKLKR